MRRLVTTYCLDQQKSILLSAGMGNLLGDIKGRKYNHMTRIQANSAPIPAAYSAHVEVSICNVMLITGRLIRKWILRGVHLSTQGRLHVHIAIVQVLRMGWTHEP